MSVSLGDKAELQGRGGLSRAAAPRAAEPRKGTVLVEGLNVVQHLSRLNPGEKSLRRGFLSQKFTNAKLNNNFIHVPEVCGPGWWVPARPALAPRSFSSSFFMNNITEMSGF